MLHAGPLLHGSLLTGIHPINSDEKNRTQLYGFGRKLMEKAEVIAYDNGYRKMAVISAIGTRNYYRKLGYKLEETYMVRKLEKKPWLIQGMIQRIVVALLVIYSIIILYYLLI